jgi:arsenical pump membrane protein
MTLLATVLIWAISFLSIVCMLLRPRRIPEAYWACGGALLLVSSRLLPLSRAVSAVGLGVNVYLFLAGMMMLAELAREEGVFGWIADLAAVRAKASAARLFLYVYLAGVIVTALLSNDATAVVLTPAVLAAVRRAGASPKPYLLACALVANAASFVLPISNPANLVIFGQHLPPLGSWLATFGLPSIAAILVTLVGLGLLSRDELSEGLQVPPQRASLSTEGRFALAGLLIAASALIAVSAVGLPLGLPTCGAAVFALSIAASRDRLLPWRVMKGVSWTVLPLVAGLFVIVEALQSAGSLHLAVSQLELLSHVSRPIANLTGATAVALLANAMNNLPIALLSGAALQQVHQSGVMAHAILIGVNVGPNLSVTGSLATILWLIALRRENVEITAWEFMRVGLVLMPVALLASVLVLRR